MLIGATRSWGSSGSSGLSCSSRSPSTDCAPPLYEGGCVGGGRSKASNLWPFLFARIHWNPTRSANAPPPHNKPPTGAATKAPTDMLVSHWSTWLHLCPVAGVYQMHSNRPHIAHSRAAEDTLLRARCQSLGQGLVVSIACLREWIKH